MEIIKEKYTLREWQLTDVKFLVKNANDIHIWRNMTDLFPHPYTEKDAEAFYPYEYRKERTGCFCNCH